MNDRPSVQERYAPRNHCFGCGPANPKGLHVRSFEEGDGLVADWTPEPHHEAFDGAVGGGILGTLLDCHSNWTAAIHLMKAAGSRDPAVHRHLRVPRAAAAGDAVEGPAAPPRAGGGVRPRPRDGGGERRGRRDRRRPPAAASSWR